MKSGSLFPGLPRGTISSGIKRKGNEFERIYGFFEKKIAIAVLLFFRKASVQIYLVHLLMSDH
jgi:hypothetical protein